VSAACRLGGEIRQLNSPLREPRPPPSLAVRASCRDSPERITKALGSRFRFMRAAAQRWIQIAGVTALLSGCGPVAGSPTGIVASAPRTSPTIVSALPAVSCPPPSNRCLALVTLRGSNEIVARDITDISHPKTVGALGPYPAPLGATAAMEGALGEFVSATEFAYVEGTSLFRAPLSGSPRTALVNGTEAVIVFAWSPDGSTVVYVGAGDSATELHQVRAGQDRVLATVPPPGLGGGCEVAPCPGPFQNPGDKWDYRLSYSADGALIAMVQSSITSYVRIWNSEGKLLGSFDSQAMTMSVWSGTGLYFRDSKGVEVWRDGVISTFLPGVEWIRPKSSPGSGQIVYEARDSHGAAHVFIVDTATRNVRDLGAARAEPAFLTSRYIWYEAEPACVASGTCPPGLPGIAAGKTYIYDLQDGTESEAIITSVLDILPRGA
jgi:hypothetical protein